MYLIGLGTAAPSSRYTKSDCWAAFCRSEWSQRLSTRARAIVRSVLQNENGIEARRLALDSLDEVFRIEPQTLHRRFLGAAPALASQAAHAALRSARLAAADIDALVVSTCTGYLCPGLSGYVIERLGLRGNVLGFDLVGHGCAAALPNLRLGHALIHSGQCRNVLSVCVEVASAAMFLDEDPGVLVSACLFGDGAGAAVLSRTERQGGRRIAWRDGESLTEPVHRGALQFELRDGMLRNVLTRAVPELSAECAERVLTQVLRRAELPASRIAAWILHAGGRDVLRALTSRLGLEERDVRYSAAVLREYGNLSSAFVYFVLEAALADGAPGGWWWLSSFGAGFSCHGALLEVGSG